MRCWLICRQREPKEGQTKAASPQLCGCGANSRQLPLFATQHTKYHRAVSTSLTLKTVANSCSPLRTTTSLMYSLRLHLKFLFTSNMCYLCQSDERLRQTLEVVSLATHRKHFCNLENHAIALRNESESSRIIGAVPVFIFSPLTTLWKKRKVSYVLAKIVLHTLVRCIFSPGEMIPESFSSHLCNVLATVAHNIGNKKKKNAAPILHKSLHKIYLKMNSAITSASIPCQCNQNMLRICPSELPVLPQLPRVALKTGQ